MIIAVDIGGTKTLVATFNKSGDITSEERFATSHDAMQFTTDLLQRLESFKSSKVEAISIASAGLINQQTGVIIHSPNLSWTNFALKQQVQREFDCPVFLENDANSAGFASVRELPQTPQIALYLTIGTGIGTSILLDGKLHPALSQSEAGHMVFETQNGLQVWEDVASGRAIKQRFGKLAVEITDPKQWNEISKMFAIGLRVLVPALQPEVVIVGGGAGTCFDQFIKPLTRMLREQIPDFIPMPTFVPATDPEKAVIRGCFYRVIDDKTASTADQTI